MMVFKGLFCMNLGILLYWGLKGFGGGGSGRNEGEEKIRMMEEDLV